MAPLSIIHVFEKEAISEVAGDSCSSSSRSIATCVSLNYGRGASTSRCVRSADVTGAGDTLDAAGQPPEGVSECWCGEVSVIMSETGR